MIEPGQEPKGQDMPFYVAIFKKPGGGPNDVREVRLNLPGDPKPGDLDKYKEPGETFQNVYPDWRRENGLLDGDGNIIQVTSPPKKMARFTPPRDR